MKKFNQYSIVTAAVAMLMLLGFAGPITALAATTPSLGAADTFGVLGGTYTNTTVTTINGDVGYTTGPATAPTMSGGTIYGAGAPTPQARTDTATALGLLDAQGCNFSYGSPTDLSLLAQPLVPGVYCITAATSIGTGGITLSGSGTYIFRITGALTSAANSVVTLANGASSCDVFWTPSAATTLGANTTFRGTIIDNANAISVGANSILTGRLLSLGAGVVTTDTNNITRVCSVASLTPAATRAPATINVVKVVVNDNGGKKKIADFPLFVNGTPVVSGVTNTFPAPAPAYAITETVDANYTRTFSGDCGLDGRIGLSPGDNKFCIVTNNDIGVPAAIPPVPPLIDVVKVPSPLALPNGAGSVTYTYTLKNIGTVPVTNITMVGDTCSPIILVSGDTNNDSKLDINETWVHTCSTVLSQTHTNTVVTTGWANGISAVDVTSATVVVGAALVPPLIHVTKTPSPIALRVGGGNVLYTYVVTNPGVAALHNVRISDDKCSTMYGPFGDANSNTLLDQGESWAYACKTNIANTTTNTVTVFGDANGLTARDFAITTVVVANAVPGLPNTGFAPETRIVWGMSVFGIFALTAFVFMMVRKNRTI